MILLAATLLYSQTECGGGGNSGGSGGRGNNADPGTPAGTYSFTVTAKSGSGTTAFSTSTQITVVLQ
jgi:hypothetical protein